MKKLTKILVAAVAVMLVAACIVPAAFAAAQNVKAGDGVSNTVYINDAIMSPVSKIDPLGVDDSAAMSVASPSGVTLFSTAGVNFDKVTSEFFSGLVSAEEEGYAAKNFPSKSRRPWP